MFPEIKKTGLDFYATLRINDAVCFAETEGCDVLLSEIDNLGGYYGGIKLAHRIREINAYAKIIFVTVAHAFEYAHELIELRIDGFIPKPYNPEVLKREFDRLCHPVE